MASDLQIGRTTMKSLLWIALLAGCAPSYWVKDADWRAAQAHNLETLPARRTSGREVALVVARLDAAQVVEDGNRLRLTPQHRKLTAGWALLGIGGALLTGAIGAFASSNPPGCHDESCWVGQTAAGASLAATGGLSMLIGTLLAATSRSAER
jgi:hypothetical protein